MAELTQDRFARFFTESRDALRRYVRRLVRSDESAEEIVQEAFLRTYEKGRSAPVPRAFLFTTARHLAVDRLQAERNWPADSMRDFEGTEIADLAPLQDERVIADEASRVLKHAIELLPPQRHAAVTLRLLHGYSHKEIAATLGLSRKTVEKHIAKGMARVHEYVRARYSGGQDG